MKITNASAYPEPFVRAVTRETYERGDCDYTVSELLSPPRLNQLVRRHDAELTEDVSERLWVLLGNVAHDILERAGKEGQELTERRLYAPISGRRIGGKPDTLALSSGLLTDYKVTSVWSYILGNKPEWERQLNAYAFLARENGHEIKGLEIFAMFRDWSESRSLGSKDYPNTSCLRIPIPLWSHSEAQVFLEERVRLHETAKLAADDDLAPCTAEERWEKPTTWAVMKPGRKSALSVHETEESAWKAMADGLKVEVRAGKSTRCESYCAASNFCNQYAAIKVREA